MDDRRRFSAVGRRVVVGVLAGGAILAAFAQFLEKRPVADKPINVTSYNQSGGITAGTVNIGAQPRHMTAKDGKQILQSVPIGSTVRVAAVMGDNEAMAFAAEVRQWMLANGYAEVGGVDLKAFLDPVFGQSIIKTDNGYEILIGARPM